MRHDVLQGRLYAAAQAYQESCDYASRHQVGLDTQLIPLAGLAEIYREWNDITESDRLLAEPMRYFASNNAPLEWFYMIDVFLAIANNKILHGEFDQAGAMIQNARQLAQIFHSIPDLFDEVRMAHIRLLLARGDLEAAVSWADRKEREARDRLSEINQIQRIAIARVHLAADRPDRAESLLADLLAELEGSDQGERLGETLILQALVLWQEGRRGLAIEVLDRVITIAEPENRIRSFIDYGEPMKILLTYRLGMFEHQPAAAKHNPGYEFTLRLIEVFSNKAFISEPNVNSLSL